MAYSRKIKGARILYCIVFYLLVAALGLSVFYLRPVWVLACLLGIYQVGYNNALLQLVITERGLRITRYYFGCIMTTTHNLSLDRLMWYPPGKNKNVAHGYLREGKEVGTPELPNINPLPSETHIIYYPGDFPEQKRAKVVITHYEALLLLDLFKTSLEGKRLPDGTKEQQPGATGPGDAPTPDQL